MTPTETIREALEFLKGLEVKSALDINNPKPEVPWISTRALIALTTLEAERRELVEALEMATEMYKNTPYIYQKPWFIKASAILAKHGEGK